jgi:hypothetical protein
LHPIKDEDKDEDDRKMDLFYPMVLREFVKKGPSGMKGKSTKVNKVQQKMPLLPVSARKNNKRGIFVKACRFFANATFFPRRV